MRKATIVATLMAIQYHWMAPAMAMYQLPLLSTTVSVAPNFVLTLDNSESMALHHLPENASTVNGYTVYMGGTHIVLLHPDDIKEHPDYNFLTKVSGTVPASTGATCVTAYECQMRSPDVNSIYYNPANLYKPWPLASDPSKRMPAASYTAALYVPDALAKPTGDPVKDAVLFADLSKVNKVGVSAVWCTSADTRGVNCDRNKTTKPFNPAIFYRLKDEKSDPGVVSSYVKYDLNDATWSIPWGKNLYTARTDCSNSCTLQQEQQNFANWFTYYRSRILLTKGAVSEAFAPIGDNIRLGWTFSYNAPYENIANLPTDTFKSQGGPVQGVLPFTAENKVKFLTAIQNRTLRGSTPLRYATAGVGRYFQRIDSWSPWRKTPGAGTGASNPILGCRRAAHILTTDGYYNDNGSPDYPSSDLAVGEVDNVAQTVNGITYTPSSPYKDGNNSNSLADIAMYYWAFPLLDLDTLPLASNTVPAKPTDPATWLHLNQYMVGLGVSGTITTPPSTTNPPSKFVWPTIPTSSSDSTSPTKIDDMLHATLNSRGKFFTATESTSLKNAMIEAINSGQPEPASESGVATSGNTAVEGDLVFTPSYQSQVWTGDITAYKLTKTPGTQTLNQVQLWRASDRLPAPGLRNIVGYSTTDSNSKAIAFKPENVGSFATIASDYRTARFIDFIRGVDDDLEPTYRHRTGKLPDFVNSTPLLIGGNLDMGYQAAGLPSGGSTYGAFVASKKARAPLLFMGGNGGMLHAFNATDSASGGIETFAYVPKGVMPNLHLLAQPVYNHHFYVDGPLTEADAYLPDGNQGDTWQNIVIGTLGAGGKGVFAIKVPVGGAQTTLGASEVMWDIDDTDKDAGTLGHVTSPVQVGYVQNNGGWYAFIGNGHDSAGGTASLIVVNLATGKVAKVFTDLTNAANVTTPNGLSGVDLIRNARGEVIGAYAGDLHGQLWRFEFDSSDSSKWKVGFGGKPLFTARDANSGVQHISAAPSHFNLTNDVGSGNLVLFGTGRLTDQTDSQDSSTQSFYGILDETVGTASAGASPFTDPAKARGLLQMQEFKTKVTDQNLIRMTDTAVPLTGSNKKYGWFVDLVFSSATVPNMLGNWVHHPKVIYKPVVIRKLVFFTAVQPPSTEESCTESKSYDYTFLLPVLTGGQSKVNTWDTDGNGVINAADEIGQGFATPDGGGLSQPKDTNDDNTGADLNPNLLKNFNKCAGDDSYCEKGPGGSKVISDRVWKRIIKPPF
ncbi:hypothetical protein JY96_06715 [Aquabacterium sp. NJ1]|nr:hypothetical protein JY96_06715 [Aquabacterium sp. NJ1]